MQKLAGKALAAFSKGDAKGCLQLLESQDCFLREHLLRWVPAFAERIARQAHAGRFYSDMAGCLNEYCTWDADVVYDIIQHLSGAVVRGSATGQFQAL
jgi:hypothetical protein